MKITERDILAVVHAEHAQAMFKRAAKLLKRSRLRLWHTCRIAQMAVGVLMMLSVVILLMNDEIPQDAATNESMENNLNLLWPMLGMLFLVAIVQHMLLNRAALTVSRRWAGNPFNVARFVAMIHEASNPDDGKTHNQETITDFLLKRLDIRRLSLANVRKIVRLMTIERKAMRWTLLGFLLFYMPVFMLPIIMQSNGDTVLVLFISCSSQLGILMLPAAMIYAGRRHAELLRHLAINLDDHLRCPECRYDLRGGHLVTVNEQRQIRCPECGWSGLVEQPSP